MMTQIEEFEAWAPRKTVSLGNCEVNGWPLKLYGIYADSNREIDDATIETVIDVIRRQVTFPVNVHWPAGFAIIHQGTEAVWLLIDVWANDILHHHLFAAPLDHPKTFSRTAKDGICACVWELEVIEFERKQWIENVLIKPQQADLQGYLDARLEICCGEHDAS